MFGVPVAFLQGESARHLTKEGASFRAPALVTQIDVQTGEKYYQGMTFVDGKMVGGEWKRWVKGEVPRHKAPRTAAAPLWETWALFATPKHV